MNSLRKQFHGVDALLIRMLTDDVRHRDNHLARALIVVAALAGLVQAYLWKDFFGAPGLQVFRSLIYLDAILIAIASTYYSTAISEEREQGTLGLLKLSGISPLGLLLGKSTARMIPALLGLILQVPFILLAVTLGGVRFTQIGAAFCALFAFLVLVVNVSLVSSLIGPTSALATGRVFGLVYFWYFLGRFVFFLPSQLLPKGGLWYENAGVIAESMRHVGIWISTRQISTRLQLITDSTFHESWISAQVLFDVTVGVLCFLYCWWTFERRTNDVPADVVRQVESRRPFQRSSACSFRAWDDAFAWKEFHLQGGWRGVQRTARNLLGVMVLGVVGFIPFLLAGFSVEYPPISDLASLIREYGLFVCVGSLAGLFLVFLGAMGRSFTIELKEQTFGALMLTPHSPHQILFSTVKGRLMVGIPLVASLIVGLVWVLLTDNALFGLELTTVQVAILLTCAPLILCSATLNFGSLVLWGGMREKKPNFLESVLLGGSFVCVMYANMFLVSGIAWLFHQGYFLVTSVVSLLFAAGSLYLSRAYWRWTQALMVRRMSE